MPWVLATIVLSPPDQVPELYQYLSAWKHLVIPPIANIIALPFVEFLFRDRPQARTRTSQGGLYSPNLADL